MYAVHSSVFIFIKGYPECDPSFPFLNEKFLNQRAATNNPFNKENGKTNINIFSFCSQHSVFNRFLFVADIWKTNLMKFVVI